MEYLGVVLLFVDIVLFTTCIAVALRRRHHAAQNAQRYASRTEVQEGGANPQSWQASV